jgi:hypothetical protein
MICTISVILKLVEPILKFEQYWMSLDAQLGVLSKPASCPQKLGMHCTRLGSSLKIAAVGMHAVPSEIVECNTYGGSLKIYLEYGLE